MSLPHLFNEKAMKAYFGPQSGVGDERVYLAETPFVTVQGEGPNIGRNTLFVRFFGCNLANSCGVKWCDTKHSFYTNPELKKDDQGNIIEYPSKPDRVTFENVEKMYENVFEKNGISQFNNIVFTGGEPMLWQVTIARLLDFLKNRFTRTIHIEIETNGTVPVETELTDWFKMVHFNISPKVHVAIKFPLISQLNNCRLSQESSFINFDHDDWILKFVYEGEPTKELLKKCIEKYQVSPEKIYLMPEGINREQQLSRMQECAEYCINNGYNFSPRLHVLVWDQCKNV